MRKVKVAFINKAYKRYFLHSKILKKHALNQDILELVLEKPWIFHAGQYTAILFQDHPFYFSIASSPFAPNIELHIQNSVAHPLNAEFAKFLAETHSLELAVPRGKAILTEGQRPLLLIAGGSGFAPMKSLIEMSLILNPVRTINLYWGVRQVQNFYHQALIRQWQDLPHFHFVPVLSEEHHPDYRYGLITEAVTQDFASLAAFDIYLAGPFPMSYAARLSFQEKGAERQYLFSDAFEFN